MIYAASIRDLALATARTVRAYAPRVILPPRRRLVLWPIEVGENR